MKNICLTNNNLSHQLSMLESLLATDSEVGDGVLGDDALVEDAHLHSQGSLQQNNQ